MLIQAESLRELVTEIFVHAGSSRTEATNIATRLTGANLSGHDSHGVVRCHRYVQSLANGVAHSDVTVDMLMDNEVLAVVDGKFGMGQTVGQQAVQIGIDKAATYGVSLVALRHAGHLGRIGDWAEMAAAAGLVSIHMVNVANGLLVAPFGSAERRFGTNPVTIGIPMPEGDPLILDFATSVVAEGKALVALNGGKPVPDNALVDGDGEITGDPSVLYGDVPEGKVPDPRRGPGALRAMGDHKGSGLAFMCEILAGVLTGSGTADQTPFCNGMLSIYVNPTFLESDNSFAADVVRFVNHVRAAEPAAGVDKVLAPGDPERQRRTEREIAGIELPDNTWASILRAAEEAGVPSDRVAEITG